MLFHKYFFKIDILGFKIDIFSPKITLNDLCGLDKV